MVTFADMPFRMINTYFSNFIIGALLLSTMACGNSAANNQAEKLLAEINKTGRYESERVGFAGTQSEQYKRYQQLLKANTTDLIKQYSSARGVAKVYLFKAIAFKDKANARLLFEKDKDGTAIHTLFGCLGGTTTVKKLEEQLVKEDKK
jgi:hypothetical protein